MGKINGFEDLDCWKACREVVKWVITASKRFPANEKYDLTDNMRRAARSSTRNLAEGFGRHHNQENLQFSRISRGSLHEVLDDMITAFEEQYITEEEYKHGRKVVENALRLVNGYIRYLENRGKFLGR